MQDHFKPVYHRVVKCPRCSGDSIYAPSNQSRPFCSERCKNIDFGDWASESFRVPDPTTADEVDISDVEVKFFRAGR
jgi:endogenous inhibitor of DNA gyrase (YacG/DUF329 family)